MGAASLALAWLASLAPLLFERAQFIELGEGGGRSTPRIALCALAWIALAGMPRAGLGASDLRLWWGSLMACAPVFALALALDIASGTPWARGATVALCAFAFVALSALAADLARARVRAARVHATLWIGAILGLPLFAAALSWGARSSEAGAPEWSRVAAQFSPLSWALESAKGSPAPYAALALLIGLCAVIALSSRGETS